MARNSDHFFRHAALLSFFTLASRVLGLVRDMACAALFGGGVVWDAFSFAFKIPNLFRRLFGEGAMSVASIPVFTDYLENRTRGEAATVIRTAATLLLLVLLACLLLGEAFFIGLPLLSDMDQRWRLAFALSAVLLPYMLFVCLCALAAAVLHSLRRFTIPAVSPIILNTCWIIAAIIVAPAVSANPREQIFVVAGAIIAAGALQFFVHLIALCRHGITYRPALELKHPAVRRILLSMAPVAVGMAAYQVNALLDSVIAISLSAPEGSETFSLFGADIAYPMQAGANSALYFADRLVQFPLGIFGIALATSIFPVLSSHAAKGEWKGFSGALGDGLGAVLFIALPAAAGLIIVGRPAVMLLFQRGAFSADMTSRTFLVLIAHSIGLWAYCGRHVIERAFFARNDQLTPVKVASVSIVLNLVLNLALIWFIAEAGLALATAVSAAVQVCVLFGVMSARGHCPPFGRLLITFCKTLAATIIMAAVCIAALRLLPAAPGGSYMAGAALRTATALPGIGVYAAAARILKIREFDVICNIFRRKKDTS